VKKFISTWLNFTAGERKGIIVFAIICAIAITARWWFPTPHYSNKITADSLQHIAQLLEPKKDIKLTVDSILEPFSAVSADSSTWVKAGLTPMQARTITRYLTKGGRIKDTSDLWKLYFMDTLLYNRLKQCVIFQIDKQFDESKKERHSIQKPIDKIDLNLADSSQLVSIHGIGPVFASRIIRYRKLLGGFVNVKQLNEVFGLANYLTPSLIDQFIIKDKTINYLDINKATFIELMRHPYIGKALAKEITKMRKSKVLVQDDLENIMTPETFNKLKSYIVFN